MNVLVTGGAGFVGSNLVKTLEREWECELTVLDDLSTGSLDYLAGSSCEFVHGSITDETLLRRVLTGCDVVFHLAARNMIASVKDPIDDLTVNIRGTFNVLSLCRELGVSRIVYSSTSSVYGNSRVLPVPEDALPLFLNFYSVSKFSGEAYAQTFAYAHKLPVSVVRYSNVYGPNQSAENPYCGVIGKFISSALKGEDLLVHGDGEQTRDFTYVDDTCAATLNAAAELGVVGDVFNVATGIETSVNHLAELVIELTGAGSSIEYVGNRDIDNIRRRALSIDKAALKLGYVPGVSLREGLARTIAWYAAQTEV
jgi:UDP-glucose 4-epimerase